MGDKNDLILGVKAILLERADKTERTIHRWLERSEAACFGLVPVYNGDGGPPTVRAGHVNSLNALGALHRAEVSSLRADVARHPSLVPTVDRNANSLIIRCSSGGL